MSRMDISMRLEKIGRKALGLDDRTVHGTFVHEEQIRNNSFVEVMMYLLRQKQGPTYNMLNFYSLCKPYLGLALEDFSEESASQLFSQFEAMYYNENSDLYIQI